MYSCHSCHHLHIGKHINNSNTSRCPQTVCPFEWCRIPCPTRKQQHLKVQTYQSKEWDTQSNVAKFMTQWAFLFPKVNACEHLIPCSHAWTAATSIADGKMSTSMWANATGLSSLRFLQKLPNNCLLCNFNVSVPLDVRIVHTMFDLIWFDTMYHEFISWTTVSYQ